MPRLLGIQSYSMSLLYLAIYVPMNSYKAGQAQALKTPARGKAYFNEQDHEVSKKQLQFECLAHGFNVGGATAFLYFPNPWGLIIGYLLWTGHYLAKIESKRVEEKPDLKDRSWIILYGFGAITCIACALFAHETITISIGITIARIFATTLSTVETGLFFYNLSQKTFAVAKVGAQRAQHFTPWRR